MGELLLLLPLTAAAGAVGYATLLFLAESASWGWATLRRRPYRPDPESGWWPCAGAVVLGAGFAWLLVALLG